VVGALGKLNVRRRLPLPSAAHPPTVICQFFFVNFFHTYFKTAHILNYLQTSTRSERSVFSLRSLRFVGGAPQFNNIFLLIINY
jgi:hypothetical protein